MAKYYVAGIPFDDKDCLKHYGVKGMKWDQHLFGVDANTKYLGDWFKKAGQNIGKFTTNAINGAGKAAQNAGKWVGSTARNVGNAVGTAASNVGNWAGNAAKDVGNAANQANKWAGTAVNNAANFVTGNKARDDLQKAKNSFFIGRGGRVNAAQKAYDQTLPGAVEKAANGAKGYINSAGKWVSTAANDAQKWANQAGQDITKTAGNVGNAIGEAANNVGNWAGQAAKDVGNTASDAGKGIGGIFNSAKNWVSDRAQDVGNAASNAWNGVSNAAQDVGNWAGQAGKDIGNAASNAWNGVSGAAQDAGNWAGQAGKDAKDFLDYRVTGYGYDQVNPNNPEIKEGLKNISESHPSLLSVDTRMTGLPADSRMVYSPEEAMNYMQEMADKGRDNSLFGRIGNAANQVGNWVGDRAQDVGNAATNAANSAGNWIGDRAKDVGNFVSEMANPHYQLDADRLMENYRNYLNEHPENPQSPKNEEWLKEQIKNDPQLRSYYEQNIKNQTIPEQRITEQTIPEQRITEQTIPEQRITEYGPISTPKDPRLNDAQQKQVDYWDGVIQKRIDDFDNYYNSIVSDPRWQNYTRQDVMDDLLRQQDYWRNRAYRENLQHSELDNRPEGVSDAFWQNYLAHGGTREQYDKDWAHL